MLFRSQEAGAASLKEEAERLYKALSEVKLKQGLPAQGGRLAAGEAGMELRFETAGAETVLPLEHQAPQEDLALQAVKAELDEIVGLTAVKDYILSLEDNFKMQQLRKERGLKADSPSMHMIFTGNPGTGKTTVARILAKYLKAIGALGGGQLVGSPAPTWWAGMWATPRR